VSGWRELKLSDFIELCKDQFKPDQNADFNYIGLEHIEQEKLRLNSIGHSSEITSNKFLFKNGDILFGKLRPYFRKVIKSKFDGVCSTDIWVVRAKKGNSQDFVFYFLANWEFINTANAGEGGSRMPRADWNFLKDTHWSIPKYNEQRAIAAVLSSLDDKIDLLYRQNKTLEAMAETLFRQWFVEGAKEDWEEGKLSDEFDFTMGQSPSGKSFNQEGIGVPMFQGNADFEFRFPRERVYTTEPARYAKRLDTLISVRAPVGAQNMAHKECCVGRGVAAFRHKKNKDLYTYTYFKLRSLMEVIKKFNDEGTIFGSISKSDFESIEISIPPDTIVREFEKITKPINDKIIENCSQIRTLEKLRDTLLPKLMSGEVRIAL
jgi:type I restriction enzyme S subunit